MNKIIIMLTLVFLTISSITAKEKTPTKTETIKVWGNCEMCESTIEKATKKVAGVVKADWDVDKKKLTVTYKPSETTNETIQKAIAAVGYDTENFTADDKAYANLHACCQYDRKK